MERGEDSDSRRQELVSHTPSLVTLRAALLSREDRGSINRVDSVENGHSEHNFSITDGGSDAFFEWVY